jgi:hypothetical protein
VVAVAKRSLHHHKSFRQSRVQLLHDALAYTPAPDGTVPAWGAPTLTFDPEARACVRTIPALPVDPHDSEDVDTDADDHAYDGLTYGLMLRPMGPPVQERGPDPDRLTLDARGLPMHVTGRLEEPQRKVGWFHAPKGERREVEV